ncbi:MAG: translation initiation factor IF-2 [Chloroflexi bacterium]|nr:translation initiation factor IF-2 [Chloroflexota bacterium]
MVKPLKSQTVTRTTRPDVTAPLSSRAAKGPAETKAKARPIEIPRSLTARQLADMLQVSPLEIIKQLMRKGIMANINQVIDYDVAAPIATELGFEARLKVRPETAPAREIRRQRRKEEAAGNLQPRAPVVTIMGHVDHGKTKLLDAIRQSNVVATEAGGITQHIGAYQAEVNGQKVTFLDTPGHEAFTAMRARGAQVTDIVVLVVAADDGVMPQTLEAIDHARAAGVPIVVAINKIDLPGANPDRVKQQLADASLVCEDWGGDTVCAQVSAKQKLGIPDLLENLLLVAEMEQLKADPSRSAVGVVVEANLDKTKGPLATVLMQDGSLRVGETVVVGNTWGRIKAMFNDRGKQVRKAEPAMPIELLGLNRVPQVGDTLMVVASDQQARTEIEKRQAETATAVSTRALRLENLFDQISTGKVKELNVILKTDVQGSIEPIRQSLERLATEQVKVRLIHSASGNVTENDVMLAVASKGLIIGFATGIEPGAKRLAEAQGIDIRVYDIIYNLVDDVEKALKGMLEPTYIEVIDGRAEVRAIFGKGKKEKVAGSLVSEGKLTRGASVRLRRQGKVVVESTISSLRRFKEDVREVATGYECGVGIEGFSDFQVGDILETYRKQKEV